MLDFTFATPSELCKELAPCYDLTYNVGVGGEHQMTIGGEGRHPGRQHLLKLAAAVDLPEAWARQTIERITTVAGQFATDAKGSGIKAATRTIITNAIEANRKQMV